MAITTSETHSCALTTQGSVECWGDDPLEAFDDAPERTLIAVAAGNYYTCGITDRGEPTCWGDQILPLQE